jgi:L-alanine-DL-glutamate epimerase-like enolase superfamily enzyme
MIGRATRDIVEIIGISIDGNIKLNMIRRASGSETGGGVSTDVYPESDSVNDVKKGSFNCVVLPPQEPGLGVELDWDLLKAKTVRLV